jgi:hypothetical protein
MVTLTLYVAQPVSIQQVVSDLVMLSMPGCPVQRLPPDQDSVLAFEQLLC